MLDNRLPQLVLDIAALTAAAAQLVAAVLVVGTLLFGARQLRELREQVSEATKLRRLEATGRYIEQVGESNLRRIRHAILVSPEGSQSSLRLNGATREDVLTLAVAYDRVALMLYHGILDGDMIRTWHGPEIREIWRRVEPIVMTHRKTLGRDRYCMYFEWMAKALDESE